MKGNLSRAGQLRPIVDMSHWFRGKCRYWPLRTLLALLLAFVVTSLATFAIAGPRTGPSTVRIVRDSKDPRWVHGTVTVATGPDDTFRRVSQVDRWSTLFSDIKRLNVKRKASAHWLIEIESATMNCGAHDYHIKILPDRTLSFVIDATGIAATGYLRVRPVADQPTLSKVAFDLFIETTGVIGWFIPESSVRTRQEIMVGRDLTDLAIVLAN